MKFGNYIIPALLILLCSTAFSQDTIRGRVAVRAGYVLSEDTPGFERFEGMRDCCKGYLESNGDGLDYYLETGIKLWILDFNIGIGYGTLSNSFYGEDTSRVLNSQLVETDGIFSHNLDTDRSFLLPNASLGVNPIWGLRLYGGAGMVLHQSADYDYIEKIESPQEGVFTETNSRSRNPQNGEIINITNPIYLFGGLSYELPMSSDLNLYLVPFAEFSQYQSSLLDPKTWDHFNYSAGVGITYNFEIDYGIDEYVPVERKESIIDTIIVDRIKQPIGSGGILIGEERKEVKVDTIQKDQRLYEVITSTTITRTDTLIRNTELALELELKPDFFSIPLEFYTESIPILPYFFFEKNSTLLSTKQENNANWEESINKQSSRYAYVYENTLSLIADRMKQNGSSIIITGYIDPTTETNCDLSKNRAEVIKGLLIERGVNPNQIQVRKANTQDCAPQASTKTQSEPAYQENRRAEITSNDNSLFRSVLLQSAPRVMAVSKDKFVAEYKIAALDSSDISAEQINAVFNTVQIKGQTESNSFDYTINSVSPYYSIPFYPQLNKDNSVSVKYGSESFPVEIGDTNLRIEVIASGDGNYNISESEDLWIRYDTSSVSKSRVSIVLFPVGKSILTDLAKKELKSYTERLAQGEELSVIGYADNIGDEDENKTLADDRANAVIKYLKSIRPDLKAFFTETSGFPIGVSSHNTPQERLLSRTVQIEADIQMK